MFKFLRRFVLVLLFAILAVGVLLARNAAPVPPDKLDYVGVWASPEMRLIISPDGYLLYERRSAGGGGREIHAQIREFSHSRFVAGFGPFSTAFNVEKEPHEQYRDAFMTVDGVQLRRVEDGTFPAQVLAGANGGLSRSPMEVLGLLQQACANGHMPSCVNLGSMFELGVGGEKDVARASVLFEGACKADYAAGCLHFGRMFQQGDGRPKDSARAATIWHAECERGHAASCNNEAFLYQKGEGVPVDLARAAGISKRACDLGFIPACDALAASLHGDAPAKEPAPVFEEALRECEAGDSLKCLRQAGYYDRGQGVTKDLAKAAQLYEKSCARGQATACANLGTMYETGEGVAIDLVKSLELYRVACQRNDPIGCYSLALRYEHGKGVSADATNASKFYESACAGGIGDACTNLGVHVEVGNGVQRDVGGAKVLFEQGCRLGNALGCENLEKLRAH